jgi:hypothetical protein
LTAAGWQGRIGSEPYLINKSRSSLINLIRFKPTKSQLVAAKRHKTQAYCVKCKAKRDMKNEKEVTFKGKGGMKRNALSGVCPTCGTKMFRILGKK